MLNIIKPKEDICVCVCVCVCVCIIKPSRIKAFLEKLPLKNLARPGSMQDTGCLWLVHWDDPEGWYGEGGGWGVQDGNTCTPVADSC